MIDKQTFRNVFADFDPEIINELVNLYIAEHPVRFNELEASLARGDLKSVTSIAHGLKGVLSQFFATEAQQSARNLELYSRELNDHYSVMPGSEISGEHMDRLRELIGHLRENSLKVIDDLKEISQEYNG